MTSDPRGPAIIIPLPPNPNAGPGGPGPGPGPGPGASALPQIVERPDALHITVAEVIAALKRKGQVFRRSRSLVVADRSATVKTRFGEKPQLGLVTLNRHSLLPKITEAANMVRLVKGKPKPAAPSGALCNALLEYCSTDGPMDLPVLRGVTAAPFLRSDGSVCATPGYDSATGIWFDPCGTVFPPLPEITPANANAVAKAALNRLAWPLRGYRFDTSVWDDAGDYWRRADTSRAVALSMLLTPFAAHGTRTRPSHVADAPVHGSGKTMLAELAGIMATGDDPPLIPLADTGTAEEFNKQLDTALLAGRSCIVLDNATGDLGRYGRLILLLTARVLMVRLFGTQQGVDIVNEFAVMISGNNVETEGEIGRRLLKARIDTGEEQPDRKAFDFDPRAEVLADRGQLCIDALTIMVAYRVAGCPAQGGRAYGSFEEWTRLVRDPLMWLGFPDIVTSNDEARAADPKDAELREVLEHWEEAGLSLSTKGGPVADYTVTEIIKHAGGAPERRVPSQTIKAALLAVAKKGNGLEAQYEVEPRRLGRWLTSKKDRRIGGRTLRMKFLDGYSRYSVEIDP